MKRLPKSIEILGETIPIRQGGDELFGQFKVKDEDILGLALLLEKQIFIRSDIPESHKPKVLAHEIFHFMLFQCGVSQSITPEIEEVLCQTFSKLYFQLKKQGL